MRLWEWKKWWAVKKKCVKDNQVTINVIEDEVEVFIPHVPHYTIQGMYVYRMYGKRFSVQLNNAASPYLI